MSKTTVINENGYATTEGETGLFVNGFLNVQGNVRFNGEEVDIKSLLEQITKLKIELGALAEINDGLVEKVSQLKNSLENHTSLINEFSKTVNIATEESVATADAQPVTKKTKIK